MTKWDLPQGSKIGLIWKNVSHHTKKIRETNHMLMTIDPEKTLDKIQHSFLTKTLSKLGMEGNVFNLLKVIYEKPTS